MVEYNRTTPSEGYSVSSFTERAGEFPNDPRAAGEWVMKKFTARAVKEGPNILHECCSIFLQRSPSIQTPFYNKKLSFLLKLSVKVD